MSFNFVEIKETEQQKSISEYSSGFKDAIKKFSKNKMAMFGLILFFILIISTVIFMLLPNYDWETPDSLNTSQWPPTASHWLGTDAFGRDLWSRIWGGVGYSVALAVVTTTLNIIIAIIIGLSMGYFERFDKFFGFIIKILYALPGIIILILFSVIFRTNNSFYSFLVITISLVFSGWVNASQQIRGIVLKVKNLDFITASQTLGTKRFIILKTFFLYSLPIIVIQYAIIFPRMIISESILGFLGLSIPDIPTLGNLINDGRSQFLNYPYQLFVPLTWLVLTTVSVQLIGFGVEEALFDKGGM